MCFKIVIFTSNGLLLYRESSGGRIVGSTFFNSKELRDKEGQSQLQSIKIAHQPTLFFHLAQLEFACRRVSTSGERGVIFRIHVFCQLFISV